MKVRKTYILLAAALLIAVLGLAACATPAPAATDTPQPPAPTTAPTTASTTGGEATATQEMAPTATEAMMTDEWANVDPSGQEIVFWHNHSGPEREAAMADLVGSFNDTNEWGITVTDEYQGSYGDIFNKMLGVLGTPDSPDLVVAYQNQAATYELADGLVDMNSLVDSPMYGLSDEEKADFFPGFFAQDVFPTFNNARLGLPIYRSMEVMYYNTDWLAEMYANGAISFDGPPTTPDQFREASCAAVNNPFSGATGDTSTSVGYELSLDASRFASWTFAFGGNIFDYNTGQYTYNSDAAVASETYLRGLFEDGCARVVTESYGDQTNFGAGVTLFTVGSTSGMPYYQAAIDEGATFDWNVAPLPHTTADPVMNIYGASISIASQTPEKTLAAWLFLKYFASFDQERAWSIASNYFPSRASVADDLASYYFDQNPIYAGAFDLLQYGITEPPTPGYDFVRTDVADTMAVIANPDQTVDIQQTLDDLTTRANENLAEQTAP